MTTVSVVDVEEPAFDMENDGEGDRQGRHVEELVDDRVAVETPHLLAVVLHGLERVAANVSAHLNFLIQIIDRTHFMSKQKHSAHGASEFVSN